MPERLNDDANPARNQCVVLNDLVICLETGKVGLQEFRAAYLLLMPHILEDACVVCKERIAISSEAHAACLEHGEDYLPQELIDGSYAGRSN